MDEFQSLEGHIVQCQWENHLIQAVAICNALSLPCFVVFDADGDAEPDTPEKQSVTIRLIRALFLQAVAL
jgi:hypothetical protein